MSSKVTGSILDVSLFKRLMRYVRPYRFTFIFVLTAAILLSVFSTLNPYLLKITVDDYITLKDYDGMLIFIGIMTGVLFLEVFFQFSFIYYANWLGQRVVYDLRRELFRRMIGFRMTFFDKSAVGRLVTRAVNDIETIASIFSQGLFMIIADLLKMLIVVGVMLSVSWKLSLIVFAVLPLILFATRKFQKAMKFAFDEVRTQVANLNTFVQERISGMHIVQLFVREHQEYQSFQEINEKHKKAWLKTVWYNSIFFPIAELSTSITIGLLVWYGGLSVIAQENGITLGSIFLFIQLTQMLFRPLRQIADKFNTLQMGMVAVQRVFALMDTDSHIPDDGFLETKDMKGKISFQNVVFSYKEGETVINDISFNVNDGETIAIVGATGSGKSTTLAAIVNEINKTRTANIITVEDPVEFIHTDHQSIVSHREVGKQTQSFAAALKAALREDPDVILVGEMRDLETVSLALTAAETGHLVFGTLHTSGAPSTINRIIDVFPPEQQAQIRAQISTSLKMVVTQRLFKTKDGQGRCGAFEVMKCTAPVQNLIREAKIHQIPSIMQTAVRDGMITMEKSIQDLVTSGKIDASAAKAEH